MNSILKYILLLLYHLLPLYCIAQLRFTPSPTETYDIYNNINIPPNQIMNYNFVIEDETGVTPKSCHIIIQGLPGPVQMTYQVDINRLFFNQATVSSFMVTTNASGTTAMTSSPINLSFGAGVYQIVVSDPSPGGFNQAIPYYYLVLEKTKSIPISTAPYDYKIHYIEDFSQNHSRGTNANTFLNYLENALTESWRIEVEEWELCDGINKNGCINIPVNDNPGSYNIYVHSILNIPINNIYGFQYHKGNEIRADMTSENQRGIHIDARSWDYFSANIANINEQELIYAIIAHEFYHGIQASHVAYTSSGITIPPGSSLKDEMTKMLWLIEGQAKALETSFMSQDDFTNQPLSTSGTNVIYNQNTNNYSYEYFCNDFITRALGTTPTLPYESLHNQSYSYALFWRHIFEHNFTSGTAISDRQVILRESCKQNTTSALNLIRSFMDTELSNISTGNYSTFSEALVDFAEKTYFHDNKWKNPDGTLIQNWDDPNSNNFYATISSYTPPPVNAIPSSNVITPVVSSINKSFAFRLHVFSFTNPGRYTFTFNGDDDGDNSTDTYHVKAYITENDIIFYNKDFVLTNGVGSLDDICIKNAAQELVLLVTRLDPDEATVNGEAYRISETIEASPVALFDANLSPTDSPFTVQFNDKSTGGIINWDWDFGDAQTATDQNPKHEYTTSGSYSVEFEVNNCATSHSLLRDNYINILPPYIIEVNVSAEGEVKYQYSRTYNDASGFQFSSNGSYIREGKDIVVEVETSLPLVSLKLVMKNEKGEVVFNETKYSNLTGSSTNWTYNISKEVIGPRLNSLWFDGTEYSGIPLVNVKEPSAPPVFIDESAVGWSIDIPFITGIDNNYFIYVQTADNSGIEPIQLYQINNCNENRLVVINNSNDVHEVNFGDGSIETLNPYTFIDHKYGVGAEVYEMQISLNGKVIKTEAIHFAN
ncbi:MAG: PKD domain-containing protein [Bacteroidales bacterium]|nr:PKD domain-containing protein [Bacteroidales bacterium]